MRDASPARTERVVIVGAGLAALWAALELAPRPVLVVSPEPLGAGASSAWAQGGIAAAMAPPDDPAQHAADTTPTSAVAVDAAVARAVAEDVPDRVRDLARLGTPFDRAPDGAWLLSREAAHGRPRVVRVRGDGAGAAIIATLAAAVRAAPHIQVLEGVAAEALLTGGGRVIGLRLARATGSRALPLLAPAVLLAGGGAAGLFALTTNPPRIRGEALGLAARAGARIADAEYVQFHPTAILTGADPAPLASEALRGAGAILVDAEGRRFMAGRHPDAELAPRDVVARAIHAETCAGRRPMLDTRAALGPRIAGDFPAVTAACRAAGIDPVSEPIPVAAAAHYHIGGVASDARGRSSLPGLWVAGETAATGLHGANRLASNGLAEALVFATRAARDIAAVLPGAGGTVPEVALPALDAAPLPDPELVAALRRAMTAGAGLIRDSVGLTGTLREIARIEAAQPDCPALANMCAAATLIAAAALTRRESRGAHFRRDFPQPAPSLPPRSDLTLARALAIRNQTEAETEPA
ncbi:L-aspartate oxidase [Roseivivax sp. CAU 1761]